MRKFLFGCLAAGSVLAGVAVAAQVPERRASSPRAELTRSEAQDRAGRIFDRMDANKDGQLDQADRTVRQRARFDRMDSDRDGALSFDEFGAPRQSRVGQRAERPADAERPRARALMGPRGGMMAPGRGADADADGTMSRNEFTSRALAQFDRLDSDRNGTITAEERRAVRRGMRRAPTAS